MLFSSAEVFAGAITATVVAVGILAGGLSAGTLLAFLFVAIGVATTLVAGSYGQLWIFADWVVAMMTHIGPAQDYLLYPASLWQTSAASP